MSNLIFYASFMCGSFLLFAPSLISKYLYSGQRFSKKIFIISAIYNMFFSTAHWIFTDSGEILFLGTYDNSIMGWPSLFFAFAYGWAIPLPAKSAPKKNDR